MAQPDSKEHRHGVSELASVLLDKLAAVAKGKEDRTLEYLSNMAAKDDAERQRELRQRREAEGLRRVTFWLRPEDDQVLRERFPAVRGGIDWQAVVARALRRAP